MLSRRSLLGGSAAAVPLVLGHSAAAAEAATTSAATTTTATAGAGLTALSVGAGSLVRLRTAGGWQPWLAADGCPGGKDDGKDGATAPDHALVPAAGVLEYQVRTTDGTAVTVEEVVAGKSAARSAVPLPLARHLANPPRYLDRAGWGADESLRFRADGTEIWPPAYFPVQTLTVHHSGENTPAPLPDPVAHVRSLYYGDAVSDGDGDFGYQLLVDGDGTVYEGRYSGTDGVPVFGPDRTPAGVLQAVNGAHVGGFNAGNVGICVLGNFVRYRPTPAAVRSLTVLIALLAKATGLDPAGTTDYVNPINGYQATLPTVPGHKEWNIANPAAGGTQCVGDYLFVQLPRIRREAAALLRTLPASS